MRAERELLGVIYQRADALRRIRRRRATVVLSSVAVLLIAGATFAAGANWHGEEVLVAGPGSGEQRTSTTSMVDPPERAIGRMVIQAIELDAMVVEGVGPTDLEDRTGLYPGTQPPGHIGNSAIAGYRTTHGAAFLHLDDLRRGDQIVLRTADGVFIYEVREMLLVAPTALEVLGPTFWSERWGQGLTSTLTLTTTHPKYSAVERLVVGAALIGEPVGGALQSQDAPHGTQLAPS